MLESKEAKVKEKKFVNVSKKKNNIIEEEIKERSKSLEEDSEIGAEIVHITLRMAKMWQNKGHTHEAIDLYKKVVKRGNSSPEVKEAKDALLSFAKKFESEGCHHLAMSLYDELYR